MPHHGDRVVDVEAIAAPTGSEACKRVTSLGIFALPDQPPRRFWGEVGAEEERDRPEPLDCIWDSPAPLVGARVQEPPQHAEADKLADTPASIDPGCEEPAECYGCDL